MPCTHLFCDARDDVVAGGHAVYEVEQAEAGGQRHPHAGAGESDQLLFAHARPALRMGQLPDGFGPYAAVEVGVQLNLWQGPAKGQHRRRRLWQPPGHMAVHAGRSTPVGWQSALMLRLATHTSGQL